jgi:hypothetical protein
VRLEECDDVDEVEIRANPSGGKPPDEFPAGIQGEAE